MNNPTHKKDIPLRDAGALWLCPDHIETGYLLLDAAIEPVKRLARRIFWASKILFVLGAILPSLPMVYALYQIHLDLHNTTEPTVLPNLNNILIMCFSLTPLSILCFYVSLNLSMWFQYPPHWFKPISDYFQPEKNARLEELLDMLRDGQITAYTKRGNWK